MKRAAAAAALSHTSQVNLAVAPFLMTVRKFHGSEDLILPAFPSQVDQM